jgi:hypothetical protein
VLRKDVLQKMDGGEGSDSGEGETKNIFTKRGNRETIVEE